MFFRFSSLSKREPVLRPPSSRSRGSAGLPAGIGLANRIRPPGLAGHKPAPPPVREILEDAASGTVGLPYREAQKLLRETALRALDEHPHDYFLLRMALRSMEQPEALQWAAALRDRHPDQPVHAVILAEALEGRDTPRALGILESVLAGNPAPNRAHLAIANIRRTPKFRDEAAVLRHMAAFLDACPAPLEAGALRMLASAGPKDRTGPVAAAVRARIVKDPQHLMAGVYEALWNLEFRAAPPAGHGAVRARILDDLARLEQIPQRNSLRCLALLRSGYQLAGAPERAEQTGSEILEKYPKSQFAKDILRERWHAAHPFPAGRSEKEVEDWARQAAAQFEQWRRVWPGDSLLAYEWFGALARIPDTPPGLIARAGEELVELYQRAPDWYGSPPVEFRVAEAFLKKRVRLDSVPRLLDKGLALAERRDSEQLARDVLADDFRAIVREGMDARRLDRARLLLDWCELTQNRERAAEVDAGLAALKLSSNRSKWRLLELRGRAAEMQQRRLDALFFYRAAVAARPQAPPDADQLRERAEQLWKELGGTDAARTFLFEKPGPVEAAALRWEDPPARPLPAFRLSDLKGNIWTLDSLKGRAALIHLWATWCGPCRAEHPEFQKLYEELKDRPDVAVLSFNIDEQAGQVAPYMEQNRYTFPVVLAREVVDQVLDTVAVPQNWFLDRQGRIAAVQIGYGGEAGWRQQIIAKLEEILRKQ